jgi:hypothetical protein
MTNLHEQLYPEGESLSLEDYYYTMYIAKCKRVEKLEQIIELLLEGRKG